MTNAGERRHWHRGAKLAGRVTPEFTLGFTEEQTKSHFWLCTNGHIRGERIAPCGRESSDLLPLMHRDPHVFHCTLQRAVLLYCTETRCCIASKKRGCYIIKAPSPPRRLFSVKDCFKTTSVCLNGAAIIKKSSYSAALSLKLPTK